MARVVAKTGTGWLQHLPSQSLVDSQGHPLGAERDLSRNVSCAAALTRGKRGMARRHRGHANRNCSIQQPRLCVLLAVSLGAPRPSPLSARHASACQPEILSLNAALCQSMLNLRTQTDCKRAVTIYALDLIPALKISSAGRSSSSAPV